MKTIPLKLYAILLLLLLVLSSCGASKKYKSEDTLLVSTTSNKDSTKSTIINQTIEDKLITPVVQSQTGNVAFDSLVNKKVDEILQKLTTEKISGDNSYSLLYDSLKKQLELYIKVAQTKNENTQVNSQKDNTKIQIKRVPVEVVKPLTKLEKFLMGLGVLSLLFVGVKAFIFIKSKTSLWA
jgi:PBP1b-binding outer membrane lipoprotein LpoB